jgi:hypothetical protein
LPPACLRRVMGQSKRMVPSYRTRRPELFVERPIPVAQWRARHPHAGKSRARGSAEPLSGDKQLNVSMTSRLSPPKWPRRRKPITPTRLLWAMAVFMAGFVAFRLALLAI